MLAFAARTVVKPLGFLKPSSLMKASGRFKAHQDALPRLPVPPLQQSLDHYLKALQPIVSEEEWAHTKQLVDEFQASGGVGERLQKGLERRARKTENWVSEGVLTVTCCWLHMHSSPVPTALARPLVRRPEFREHILCVWHLAGCWVIKKDTVTSSLELTFK
ncbi:CRAT isoform 5 [Pongo abelii]|uniref:CRAT isoform 5 n=1 Tax=Pongo abelii TaxID=9601 RepID=A0A2J8UJK6_PONAB|nr:CRAT isoform 5 [Pongo abelii]